ncbi:SMI1/KNR4 family protein [Actinoplanes aureus]|uniref:AAA family ATPase n=1 Tax=Actinoplanes aureus TaxID=2792083 RepID=A0A931FVP2_9ACTN|nr:SMI1/KNR4 family protein [Actinoplanes aureus]MBG0561538.1 AAA family ATPase [Actinoplanes aureus]
MNQGWPGHGAWMVTATSAGVDWRTAVAALAAAAEVPVAVVVVGETAGDDPARPHLAGRVELPGADQLTLDQARDLIRAVTRAYTLVLVAGSAGPAVPVGRDGWTLTDLAAAVGAPAVVVAGPGPDAVNHATLALDALAGHGVAACVVTIGDVELDEAALPVRVAGRIPADTTAGFDQAAEWLDPALRATGGTSTAPEAAVPERRPPVSGRKVVLSLLAVFVVMVLVVCNLAWWSRSPTDLGAEFQVSEFTSPEPTGYVTILPVPPLRTSSPRPAAADACPQSSGPVAVGKPDATTTARVNAAWRRIEKWLAKHAPASARSLRPPARAARIDDLQRRMSVAFPADLVASLRRHDGASGFTLPPFFTPESLDGILGDWKVNCGILTREGMAGTNPWWHRSFVPFAGSADGGSLVTDQRPDGRGQVGEFYAEDGTTFERWPGSVAELLELTAASLETGQPWAGRYRPRVDGDGALDWEII